MKIEFSSLENIMILKYYLIFEYGLPNWIAARNPVYSAIQSDSNLTNKEFPVLEIPKLPKFPISFAI